MTATVIYDELGNTWKVKGGDPAAHAVNKLTRMNYRLLVLPFLTLATGNVAAPTQQPEDVIRRTRLADCLEALK